MVIEPLAWELLPRDVSSGRKIENKHSDTIDVDSNSEPPSYLKTQLFFFLDNKFLAFLCVIVVSVLLYQGK